MQKFLIVKVTDQSLGLAMQEVQTWLDQRWKVESMMPFSGNGNTSNNYLAVVLYKHPNL